MYCLSLRLSKLIMLVIGWLTLASTNANATLQTIQITDNVYALVGELSNRSTSNLGNNATFGIIVTQDSVVLIDSGAGTLAAQAIETQVRKITPLPISHVINTGGQDHRWLGNAYFYQQGAQIIASLAAITDHNERAGDQLNKLNNLLSQDPMQGLEPMTAQRTFTESLDLQVGGVKLEIRHLGAAHTPGDAWVYLPEQKILFTGDIAYGQRMLGVIEVSDSASWIQVFAAMAELDSQQVIPGHGLPSDISTLTAQSYDYLVHLRTAVGDFIDQGGDLSDIRQVDQSKFSYLRNYEGIAPGNALRVFEQMEWE